MDVITFFSIVVGLIYCGILFIRPKINFYILIFLCIFQFGWFERYFAATAYLGRLTYFAAMISGCRIFIDFLLRKIIIKKTDFALRIVYQFILALVILIFISNFYNGESLILGFYEIRYYLIMVVLCSGIYYYDLFDLNSEKFIKAVVLIGLLQIPFAVLKYILAGGGGLRTLDSVTGTFSVYGSLVANQLLAIGLVLSYKVRTKKNIINLNSYILIVLLLVPLLLSKSRSASGFAVLMIAFVYLKDAVSKYDFTVFIKNLIIGFAILSITVAMFVTFFWKNYDIKQQLNVDYIVSYFTKDPVTSTQRYLQGTDPRMGRVRSVTEAVRLISKTPLTFLIGCGSGSISEASLLNMEGSYFQWYGPLAGLWRTQYAKIIAELGIVGFGLFVFLFYRILMLLKFYKLKHSLAANNYQLIVFILLLLSIYLRVIDSHYFVFLLSLFFCSTQYETDSIIESTRAVE